MQFSDIPGLDTIKNQLLGAVHKKNIPHAMLFDGKRGSAALPLAIAFATFLNCENPTETDSCGECANCRKMKSLAHPDVTFTYPTAGGKKVLSENFINEWRKFVNQSPYGTYSDWLALIEIKQGNIPVEESRQIIQNLSLKSYQGGYKMVIIWNLESMAAPAANALLKILEEPSDKTIFLLITSDYNRLLATIQSRVQRFAVPELEPEAMQTYLIETRGLTEERAAQIAFLADGNIHNALDFINQRESDHKDWFRRWMRYCYAFDLSKLVPLSEEFDSYTKEAQKTIMEYGLRIIREIYLANVGLDELIKLEGDELDFVQKFSRVFKFENIDKISELISEAIVHIDRNVRPKIVFMDLSMSLSALIK